MEEPAAEALQRLLRKYEIHPAGDWRLASRGESPPDTGRTRVLVPGQWLEEAEPGAGVVPLLPWRTERRFVELKRLVEEQTVAPLVMCRLARFTDRGHEPVDAILYRMLDLGEWLTGRQIVALFAASNPGGCTNVIVSSTGGLLWSIEAAATLPAGSPPIDRHELIARRGVASDRVVDTQVPQSSVYLLSEDRSEQHTDTDAELFGLSPDDVSRVRAACRALSEPTVADEWRSRHRRLRKLVSLAAESGRMQKRLAVGGA